jgi:hypothetical protein
LHNYSRSIADRKGLILQAPGTISAFEDDAASSVGPFIFPPITDPRRRMPLVVGLAKRPWGSVNAPSPRLSVQVRVNVHVERL